VICPRDHRLSGLERLAQRVEHLRIEFRKLVEEQHAEMGKRRFAWPRSRAAADQCSHARRMVRRTERSVAADAPSGEVAGKTPDHAYFQHLGRL
jgi:cob(I)alamin adenosyltransferase